MIWPERTWKKTKVEESISDGLRLGKDGTGRFFVFNGHTRFIVLAQYRVGLSSDN
jgi:hypothetical protein